ncbi:MAG: NADH-quinone oxidoreductase subunit L [Gemmataceae bacterium]
MSDPRPYLWLVPALPLLGAAITALGGRWLRDKAHWPCLIGSVGACIFSALTLTAVAGGFAGSHAYYTWFQIGDVDVSFALRADALTAVMLMTVTFVGSLIVVFAIGYMHGDPGYPRFFAAVSLFLAAMTLLVSADNFLLLYAGWEGVGVCSYLLIGFWFTKPSAAAAARKAFLVTRLGDIGLFVGIVLLWVYTGSMDMETVFQRAPAHPEVIGIACLCLFIGAAGKSAQFPLHVWLPDAMEGPTPVSALIHAATMVTAGVYLLARCTPLFALAPMVQLLVATIATITALLAALIALTQTDLKKVLAYSTISQLGYMFLALGSALAPFSQESLVVLGVSAAIFHLFTHAFFKALLFLASGSVMHAMGNVIDMRRFSGLRKVLPTTHWTFLCGAAALAGVPLLSGFWSKDDVVATTLGASHSSGGGYYYVLFILAMVTAGLTAFYTFRAYFLTFWGETRIPDEAYLDHGHGHTDAHAPDGHAHDHAHLPAAAHAPAPAHASHEGGGVDRTKRLESPPVMLLPLIILAIGALGVGLAFGPTGLFSHFLEEHWMRAEEVKGFLGPNRVTSIIAAKPEPHHFHVLLMVVSGVIALGGIALAYLFYVKRPEAPAMIKRSATGLYDLSRNRFYLDEIFAALIVKPAAAFAQVMRVIDFYIVDGLVDLAGQVPAFVGYLVRPIQNGLVQFYALLMALGVAGFLLAILLR